MRYLGNAAVLAVVCMASFVGLIGCGGGGTTGDGTNQDPVAPTVGVGAPNGGEVWLTGSTQEITWTASDNVGVTSVSIALSANGGSSFSSIAGGQPNDGVYPWVVPMNPTEHGRIRITALDAAGNSAADTSDADFGIVVDYKVTTASGITLSWKVDGLLLRVKVRAPSTGWVAVGFDPVDRMQGANLIIGYVSAGTAFIRDEYGTGPTSHSSDVSGGGTDNVTDNAGSESAGVTEITFSIPLNSGDSRDRVLVEGNTYTIILAYGPSGADNFSTQHALRTLTRITL